MGVQEECVEVEPKREVVQRSGFREGVVAAIFIGPEAQQPMASVNEVRAIAGHGLQGDRYSRGAGTFPQKSPNQQVTLIEAEAVEAAARDYELEIDAAETRRNLLTRNVALNHLV